MQIERGRRMELPEHCEMLNAEFTIPHWQSALPSSLVFNRLAPVSEFLGRVDLTDVHGLELSQLAEASGEEDPRPSALMPPISEVVGEYLADADSLAEFSRSNWV